MNNSEAFHQLPIAEVPKHVRAELADFLKEREPQIAQIGRPVTNAIEHLERLSSAAESAFDLYTCGQDLLPPMVYWAMKTHKPCSARHHRWSLFNRARLFTMTSWTLPIPAGATQRFTAQSRPSTVNWAGQAIRKRSVAPPPS